MAGRLAASASTCRHVSSGDLLRDAVKQKTAAGIEADTYMKRGELVPDALIAKLIRELMAGVRGPCTLLLDGFPRTVAQAEILEDTIGQCGARLTAVVLLDVADSVLVDRIAGRRGCPKCGAGYHVVSIPPRREGLCDVCGAGLVVRKDDAPETVRQRLQVYHEQTEPLKAFYESRGKLRIVEGQEEVADTTRLVLQALED